MKAAKERIYHYRGPIEVGIGNGYEWHNGYSENSVEGLPLYPWMTYRQCQHAAKKDGYKALFYRDGKPQDARLVP